jgi:cystathionine gamma-lyase
MELPGGLPGVEEFVSGLELFTLAESLGGVESLVCYPAKMTHGTLGAAERKRRGINDNLVRLSVGIENREDLREDLSSALRRPGAK